MDRNTFYNNLRDYKENSLSHYGILGQKWGQRRWQNQDGTFNEEGKVRYFGQPKRNPKGTVFISGSSKTQFENNEFYRKNLPAPIQNKIKEYINQGKTILVGDAPGIDRQVQDFLKANNYKDVEVYSPGKKTRYSANPEWKVNHVNVPDAEEGSSEWLKGKDEAMTERATEGLAITIENGAQATRNNIDRLKLQDKSVNVFELKKDGSDDWTENDYDSIEYTNKLKKRGYIENDEFNLDEINNHMHEDFEYDNSDHKLQTPQDTFKKSSGNCHDQTLFEIDLLKKNGYDPKALFLMEVDPNTGEGGQTHSFVYFNPYGDKTNPNDQVNWFENAWNDKAGIHSYLNLDKLKKDVERQFGTDKNKYTEIVWGDFNGEPGDTLQEIIDKSLK